ncbi:site-specific integrase [Actinoplanes sp. NBRC 103695]|uniref:tyrosine-type recombinase/integrase n=1 Tax=Actinoplanes sp. NBRC 103695 TaxID=3032202 RepID=UPI00255763DF|nr:site-specific integrase [Actinoplanes sp. NBRC 103695]
MASMKKRGRSFEVRWRSGRQGGWQTCTFADGKLAEAAQNLATARGHKISDTDVYVAILGMKDEVEEDLGEDEAVPTAPLLRDWIEEWLTLKVDVVPRTHKEYARLLRARVVPELGDLRVDEIDRDQHLDPWKVKLSSELMAAGVTKHWSVLSMVMRDAVPRFRADNPLQRRPGHRSNGLPKVHKYNACFLSTEEADLLVAACPDAIRDLVKVALGTGMRMGELFGLRVGAVDLRVAQPVAYVEQTLDRGGNFAEPKSERSRRPVQLPGSVSDLLAERMRGKRRGDLIFTSPGGKPWDSNNFRSRYWYKAVAAAQRCRVHPPVPPKVGNGKKVRRVSDLAVSTCDCTTRLHQRPRFHDLRHSHVAYLIDAGWDFFVIQHHIGHASIKTTFDVYGHRLTRGDKARLKALDERLPGGSVAKSRGSGKGGKKVKKPKRDSSSGVAGLDQAA